MAAQFLRQDLLAMLAQLSVQMGLHVILASLDINFGRAYLPGCGNGDTAASCYRFGNGTIDPAGGFLEFCQAVQDAAVTKQQLGDFFLKPADNLFFHNIALLLRDTTIFFSLYFYWQIVVNVWGAHPLSPPAGITVICRVFVQSFLPFVLPLPGYFVNIS